MPTRLSLLTCMAALTACAHGGRASRPSVLFVCQYGSVKSAVAREMTRHRATDLGIGVDVLSRDITPQDHISPALAEHLAADDVNATSEPIRRLDEATLHRADIVVLLAPLPPEMTRVDARDWTAVPSPNHNYPEAKQFLAQHINALLASVSAGGGMH